MRKWITIGACVAVVGTGATLLLPSATSAASAAMPTCAAANPIVWVTTSTKTYVVKGQAGFGKGTGKYACRSSAMSMGAHAAPAKMMVQASPQPQPSSSSAGDQQNLPSTSFGPTSVEPPVGGAGSPAPAPSAT